jgi:translocation and assembly module TamB
LPISAWAVSPGLIDYSDDGTGAPQGHVAIQVRNFSRSGLVLTSHPVDLYLVGQLDAAALQTRAVVKDQGAVRGRLQAAISDMPRGGTLPERLRGGKLNAQIRYSGPAEALWRLAAVEAFDFTGPLGAVANVTGTIDAPVLTGALAAKGLRVRSSLIGADIQNVEATGSSMPRTFRFSALPAPPAMAARWKAAARSTCRPWPPRAWASTCGSPPAMPN